MGKSTIYLIESYIFLSSGVSNFPSNIYKNKIIAFVFEIVSKLSDDWPSV